VVLCITLQAIAASCTYVLARRASNSTAVGVAAAILVIISSPRLYNTTKVIVPVVTILLQWRYADAPRRGRLLALAGWTAIAFLLRHDYVVYVVASTFVLFAVLHRSRSRDAIREAAIYGTAALLLVSPWLLYVQWNEGLFDYASAALRFVQSEGRRTAAGGPQPLYYVIALIPISGLALAIWLRSRSDAVVIQAQLASLSVLVLMMNAVFLRDVLATRIPDVMAPTTVLAAALIGQVFSRRALRIGALLTATAALVLVTISLANAGLPNTHACCRRAASGPHFRPARERVCRDPAEPAVSGACQLPLTVHVARAARVRQRLRAADCIPGSPAIRRGPSVLDSGLLRNACRYQTRASASRSGERFSAGAVGGARCLRAVVARTRRLVSRPSVRALRLGTIGR
jgi:hypothetical protein